MRTELETIEKIERYLNGSLSAEESAAFELEISNDATLSEAVAQQRDIMQGINRTIARQKVVRAGQQYHSKKNFLRLATGAAVVAIIITTAVLFIKKLPPVYRHPITTSLAVSNSSLPDLNEAGKRQWVAADSLVPAQTFQLLAGRDTVIETSGGIVLSIPANAFMDAAGKAATGMLSLVIKEALDPEAIMRAGLSTRSGTQLLETGGMFFIDARQGNSILKINPAAGIYTIVPANIAKPGMQLFTGKRTGDGSIDWQDPKPLSHDLLAADILGLDFYPPDYFALLHKNGYPSGAKKFTDSVYYSLAASFSNSWTSVLRSEMDDTVIGDRYYARTDSSIGPKMGCGINPAKIKTIWSSQYQNTLLATHEFEQRMKLIHRSKNPALLDLYVNNLGKNLYEIDAMAARITIGEIQRGFLQFAALRDGKVKRGSAQFEKLRDYYALKTGILTEAIAKTQNEVQQAEAQANSDAAGKRAVHQMNNEARIEKNFREELTINIQSAYQQLGYQKAPASAVNPPASGYAVTVTNTGWSNVDRYVLESTTTRTTLDYTDSKTGKKAVINYRPITVTIADAKDYDRVLVYLLPNKLSGYMDVKGVNGIFTESLNGLMKYDLVCIGFKGNQEFFLKMNDVTPKNYDALSLKAMPAKDINAALNGLKAEQGSNLGSAVDYALWDLQNLEIQRQRRKWKDMIADLTHNFFPCEINRDENEKDVNSDAEPADEYYFQ